MRPRCRTPERCCPPRAFLQWCEKQVRVSGPQRVAHEQAGGALPQAALQWGKAKIAALWLFLGAVVCLQASHAEGQAALHQ